MHRYERSRDNDSGTAATRKSPWWMKDTPRDFRHWSRLFREFLMYSSILVWCVLSVSSSTTFCPPTILIAPACENFTIGTRAIFPFPHQDLLGGRRTGLTNSSPALASGEVLGRAPGWFRGDGCAHCVSSSQSVRLFSASVPTPRGGDWVIPGARAIEAF